MSHVCSLHQVFYATYHAQTHMKGPSPPHQDPQNIIYVLAEFIFRFVGSLYSVKGSYTKQACALRSKNTFVKVLGA